MKGIEKDLAGPKCNISSRNLVQVLGPIPLQSLTKSKYSGGESVQDLKSWKLSECSTDQGI